MGTFSGFAVKMRGGTHPKHLIEKHLWFMEYIDVDNTIVDLGCGKGHNAKAIWERNVWTGVLEFDKDDSHGYYTDLEWCIPLPDKCADRVMLMNVLEHIENRKFLLKNISRILKDNGMLLLSVPNANTSMKRLRRRFGFKGIADSDHKIEYNSLREIEMYLFQNNFRTIASYPIVIDTFWAGLIDLIGGFNLSLYKKLQEWKRNQVYKNPSETTGWQIVCVKADKEYKRTW